MEPAANGTESMGRRWEHDREAIRPIPTEVPTMNTSTRTLAVLATAACLVIGALPAQAHAQGRHGGHGGGYHAGGWGWRGAAVVGIGVGIGLGAYYGGYWGPYGTPYYPYYPYANAAPYYPGYAVIDAVPADAARAATGTVPAAARSAPDPIIYPRNGQSQEQTEADRQGCNRWATTQPAAMADAGVFQRAVAACLDGRGYTVR
jgi:hypothetical protein